MLRISRNKTLTMTILAMVISITAIFNFGWLWLVGSFIAFQIYWCCGLSAGIHRYFGHSSFETTPFWREFMLWAACTSISGHPVIAALIHHEHHKYSDTDKDPHNHYRKRLLVAGNEIREKVSVGLRRKILTDPVMSRCHRYYLLYPLLTIAVLAVISPWAVVYLWAIPVALVQIFRNLVTVKWAHEIGYQSWDSGDQSRNSKLLALIFGGEGLHNNHHKYPARWDFAMKKGEIDPTSWFVRMIKK